MTTHNGNVGSKAQWEKTKPKSRCQCHACGERESQGQNYSYLHGNHLPSTMFGAFRGCRRPDARQTIAIAVKYPMRSAVIVISSITAPATLQRCCKNGRKTVPYVTTEIGGEMELFPALRGTAQSYPSSSLSAPKGPPQLDCADRSFKPAGGG